jgi:hypothetical protein
LWWRVIGGAIENAAQHHSEAIDPAGYDARDRSRPVSIDFQQLFLDQESDEEDSAELADALAVLDTRFPVGTFKAADIASLINANGNTTDGTAVREFLFPGGKVDQVVSTKAVSKRLGAHVGNPVRLGEKILSLCGGCDSHSKTQTFFVKSVAA